MQCDSRLSLGVASAGQSVTDFGPAYNGQEGVLGLECAGPSFSLPTNFGECPVSKRRFFSFLPSLRCLTPLLAVSASSVGSASSHSPLTDCAPFAPASDVFFKDKDNKEN
ncbi:hypothetical protein CORC01_04574 [Colletotrichum orchidophilum]|uniref:Uncharacterized protein n=1 Tax=Colletotrichum orchidophilum TaxID=1209926 RepID=A0A1G4BFN6_9PEZI|nr:uncharacterized protein CORC01_04574 [Colletotrichum orchidophilum]OHF00166.1 hypothetical protein CORC01_04574 [Colletotrichum orchidophilum]